MTNIHLTLRSSNRKVGPIPVSTTSAETCPDSCPLKAGGCYAKAGGPLALHWRKVTNGERGTDWSTFLDKLRTIPTGTPFRHAQAGDLAGDGDTLDTSALAELTDAVSHLDAWCYTHKPLMTSAEREAVRTANMSGFTVNLSANNLRHADTLAALNIGPVAVVLPTDQTTNTRTPRGRKVVVCPAMTHDNVTCESCMLCAIADRDAIIGFPAHSSQRRKAEAIAMEGTARSD